MIGWIIAAVVGWLIVAVVVALLVGGGIRIADRRSDSTPRCRVDEEWNGLFIGRRWCSTHEVHWDGGGTCPHAGQPRRVGSIG